MRASQRRCIALEADLQLTVHIQGRWILFLHAYSHCTCPPSPNLAVPVVWRYSKTKPYKPLSERLTRLVSALSCTTLTSGPHFTKCCHVGISNVTPKLFFSSNKSVLEVSSELSQPVPRTSCTTATSMEEAQESFSLMCACVRACVCVRLAATRSSSYIARYIHDSHGICGGHFRKLPGLISPGRCVTLMIHMHLTERMPRGRGRGRGGEFIITM